MIEITFRNADYSIETIERCEIIRETKTLYIVKPEGSNFERKINKENGTVHGFKRDYVTSKLVSKPKTERQLLISAIANHPMTKKGRKKDNRSIKNLKLALAKLNLEMVA